MTSLLYYYGTLSRAYYGGAGLSDGTDATVFQLQHKRNCR